MKSGKHSSFFASVCLVLCAFAAAGTLGYDPAVSETVIGNLRVQALSPTLVRVERRGPLGFEDRNTFTVVNRSVWAGVPILSVEEGERKVTVKTAYYQVEVST